MPYEFKKKYVTRNKVAGSLLLRLLCMVFLAQAATSCALYAPDPRSGLEETSIPESFSLKETLMDPDQRWWETFDDSQLNGFVDEAFSGNQTLASYWARLEKAQAQAKKAGADFWPSLGGDAGVSHSKIRTDDGSSSHTIENRNYSAGLVAGYEVDLWGRIRADQESASLDAEASREDLNAAAMTVAAEVTERWVNILSLGLQLQLLEKQLSINKTYLDLVELRFRNSLASALDVLQQKQLVEKIKAQMPLIEMQKRLLQNQLAVLLGRMPNELAGIARRELPFLATPPAAGLPVQLLQNRPDIVGALKRLEAADQDLAAARAERLPALRLIGSASYDSGELDQLFDNWILNLAAGLTAPIFDGGRRKAEVDINQAAVKQQLAEYRQVVLSAVREVEDALIMETKTREYAAALENQLEVAQIGLEEAAFRYTNGLSDYLPVLTQLLSVQNLELDLIVKRADLLIARMNLYRAIGGTWTDELESPDRDKISKTGNKNNEK